jgi:ubiquinone/menaquinone biosynthesis C-methylase UbiE
MTTATKYILGSDESEIARLDHQAETIAAPTRVLLRAAGIAPGMRVLDLGTGLGHVAREVAEIVGPDGEVVAVDRDPAMLANAAAHPRVRYVAADARTYRDAEPFDAIVCRLLLFHLPDNADVVRHHLAALKPGGRFVALDYDLGACRTQPVVPLYEQATVWIESAFAHAGADPRVGAHLHRILRAAGCEDVTAIAMQNHLAWDDARGPEMIAGVLHTLTPTLLAAGIAEPEELEDLRSRLASELADAEATMLAPALVGAWGTTS